MWGISWCISPLLGYRHPKEQQSGSEQGRADKRHSSGSRHTWRAREREQRPCRIVCSITYCTLLARVPFHPLESVSQTGRKEVGTNRWHGVDRIRVKILVLLLMTTIRIWSIHFIKHHQIKAEVATTANAWFGALLSAPHWLLISARFSGIGCCCLVNWLYTRQQHIIAFGRRNNSECYA